MQSIGKFIVVAGLLITIVGVLIYLSDRIPGIGRLPGDIVIKRENFSFYFSLGTSILFSIIISLILYLMRRFS